MGTCTVSHRYIAPCLNRMPESGAGAQIGNQAIEAHDPPFRLLFPSLTRLVCPRLDQPLPSRLTSLFSYRLTDANLLPGHGLLHYESDYLMFPDADDMNWGFPELRSLITSIGGQTEVDRVLTYMADRARAGSPLRVSLCTRVIRVPPGWQWPAEQMHFVILDISDTPSLELRECLAHMRVDHLRASVICDSPAELLPLLTTAQVRTARLTFGATTNDDAVRLISAQPAGLESLSVRLLFNQPVHLIGEWHVEGRCEEDYIEYRWGLNRVMSRIQERQLVQQID